MNVWNLLHPRKLGHLTSAFFAQHLQYRLEILFWLLSHAWPFFWMALWSQAAAGGSLAHPPTDYVRYFFFAWLAGVFNVTWSGYLLSYAVRSGDLSFLLLRPFPPFFDFLTEHLGTNLVQLPLAALVAAAVLVLLPETRALPPLLPFLALLVLYFAFEYVFGWLLGSLAFWFEKSENFYEFYAALRVYFGGMALPLIAMPVGVRKLLLWTPLPYYAYAPGALAAGWPLDLGRAALVLVLWTGFVGLLAGVLWRAGLRRYGAVGG
ncbi:MAG TPA: hypothetical protein ENK37_04100 [Oceanithermus profundus]|uniref:ABC transporter permease n=1 Tax=Oceanithermus profundus TaxID=187137 RepID=A0A7C4V5C0_9DEIN|nr:hypothetical protein [Oceanithermus profundus]